MFWNAKNGSVQLAEGRMDYVAFGTGSTPLVLLPGIGLGLQSLKGMAVPFALMYRIFAKEFRVYVFDRLTPLAADCTTRQMARQQAEALRQLGLQSAVVVGVSHGGMVAQWLAVDHPQLVAKLVLAVTAPCPNPTLTEAVTLWSELAARGDYVSLMKDTGKRMYSVAYQKKNGWTFPLVGKLTAPKSPDRFLAMAASCLSHDAAAHLGEIGCPTFVIGGEQDLTLTGEASRQMAAAIAGSRLLIYPDYGHGLYEEAADFNRQILQFVRD